MGFCRYCGQKAGWFTYVHDACIASARQGCDEIFAEVVSTMRDKLIPPEGHPNTETWVPSFAEQVWIQLKPTLDQIVTEHTIPSGDLRNVLLQGWSAGAEQVALTEPLNPDRQWAMSAFHRVMGFHDEEVCKTNGFTAASLSVLLWSVMVDGDPSHVAYLAGDTNHPFNIQAGEIPLFFFGSVVYSKETASRSYQGGYGGMSVRIARGVYYHFGGFQGQRIDSASLQEVDYGGLLLTTQNIYFGGAHTTFRLPYDKVVSFRAHTDGIAFFRDTSNAKGEVFTVLEANPSGGNPISARPIIGWFLFNVAHFLAQPEARELYGTRRNRSVA